MTNRIPSRYHRIDGWRGYRVPGTALVGGSVFDDWSDKQLATEVRKFRREVLIPNGIKPRGRWGNTSNVFCAKWWICVSPEDFRRVVPLVRDWVEKNNSDLRVLHDADLGAVQ